MSRILPILLLGASACSGPDTNFTTLLPVLAVAPESLDIGEVGPPLSGVGEIFVTNSGKADLEVVATLEGGGDALELPEEWDELMVIEPGVELILPVLFTPPTFKVYTGRVRLATNDDLHPVAFVPVQGEGVDLPFPDIAIEPSQTIETPLDMLVGDDELLLIEILNEGDANLELGDILMDGPPVFSVAVDASGYTVFPGDRTAMIVEYTPTQDQGDTATLTIPSNDPDEPETEVLLIGNGGGDFEYPIAAIDCPTTVQLTGPVTEVIDGSESYDPAGLEPLTYQWIVTRRPSASDNAIPLDPDTTESIELYVDVAGTWEVQLQVTNQLGTPSVPALCSFDALPADDLHVELSWDTALADMDLHVTQGGAALFDVPEDVCYCNPNPDWGTSSSDDDPRLDIDDLGGYGPENINVFDPEPGTYEVSVHYFRENGDGPVTTTVRVFLFGAEVYAGPRVLVHDDVWHVGTIDMGSGGFLVDPMPNTTATRRGCP